MVKERIDLKNIKNNDLIYILDKTDIAFIMSVSFLMMLVILILF